MKWIKNVVVDIVVSIIIVIGVLVQIQWLQIVIIAYTGLMLFLKFMAVVNEQFMKSVKKTTIQVPLWFTSSLYAFNVFILLGFAWYTTALQWILIWLFSWLAYKKSKQLKGKREKR
jgi:hypothetical protein